MARDPDKPEVGSPRAPADETETGAEKVAEPLTDQELSDQVARVVALLQKLETLHSEQQKVPPAPEDGLATLIQRPAKELATPVPPQRLESLPSREEPPRWISDATESDDDDGSTWRRYLIPAGLGLALLIAVPVAFLLMPGSPRISDKAANVGTTNGRPADATTRAAGVIAADVEAKSKAEEDKRLAAESDERARRAAEADARRIAAAEEARLAQAEARRKAEEEKRLAAEVEAKRKAEEQERLAAEAETKRKAEEQERLAAEAEAKRKAVEQERLAAEAEAKRKAVEQERLAAEAEAKRKADEEKRLAAEAEAKRKAEEEKRLAAEAEAKRKAEEEKRLAAEAEAKRKADEEKRLAAEAEAEAKRKAEAEKRLAAEALAKRIAADSEAPRRTTTAAISGTLAPGAAKPGPACTIAPSISTEPLSGGRTRIMVSAPCRVGEPVTVWYGPFAFVQTLDSAGNLDYPLDLFMGEAVITRVGFAGGSEERISPRANDIAQVSKIAVIWKAPVNLDLHAFEYLARPGGRGHVWAGAPSSGEKSKAEAIGGKLARGFLSSAADAATLGDKVEVYTLWNVTGQEPGVISTLIDYETRGDTPSGETCGTGNLARASYRLLLFSNNQIIGDEQRALAPATCGEPLSREVRFNPDTSISLSVRRQ